MNHVVPDNSGPSKRPMLPLPLQVPMPPHFFGGDALAVTLYSGLTVFLGPNATGKTHLLRAIKPILEQVLGAAQQWTGGRRITRFLAAGRSAPFERYRGPSDDPGLYQGVRPTAVGHTQWSAQRHVFESLIGDVLALQERADLKLKVEARLQVLFRRRLRMRWTQNGIEVSLLSTDGEYPVTTEASGVLHLVGLLAALYDDAVGAVLIDEPEVSLHPQLQAFLLEEIRQIAGDPTCDQHKKLVVLSTHAQGVLPLRRVTDLPNLVFFTDPGKPPRQIAPQADELRRRSLRSLVARLGEGHRAAFFARTVLLVEGPSDEILISALAAQLDHSLARSGAQLVPVIGKGEMSETVQLFRLMGKRVVVLADLDALVDNNALINSFAEGRANEAAIAAGHYDLLSMDRSLRNDFARVVEDRCAELEPLAAAHRYFQGTDSNAADRVKRYRRAALAVLLSIDEAKLRSLSHGQEWASLRARFDALLNTLEADGCFLLRRGSIEDYYLNAVPSESTGKPEAAVAETAMFAGTPVANLRLRYADMLRAIECAAPAPPVDENAFLRQLLGGLLGAVFQALKPDTDPNDLTMVAAAGNQDAAQIFVLENASIETGGTLALRVHIRSALFSRSTFPAVIRHDQNLHTEVHRLLP